MKYIKTRNSKILNMWKSGISYVKIAHPFIVNHLSQQDLGDALNSEWSKRFEKLIFYLKRTRKHIPKFLCRFSYPHT